MNARSDVVASALKFESLLPPALQGSMKAMVTSMENHAQRSIAVHRWDIEGARARLVIVHGAGGNGLLLAPFGLAARRAGFSVTSFDLPGYGMSRATDLGTIRYHDFVDVACSVITQESMRTEQPIVLLGMSIGGRLALEVAGLTGIPSHVVATNLIDPRDREVRPLLTRFRWMAKLPDWTLSFGGHRLSRARIPMKLVSNMRAIANNPTIRNAMLADRTSAGAWMPLGFLDTLMTTSSVVAPEDFRTCPVTLAQPGDDRWTPLAGSERFLRRITNVPTNIVMLPNAGHAPLEQPGSDVLGQLTVDVLQSSVGR
jgi:alpha-beta hydrolase superfamily lysophospholipase